MDTDDKIEFRNSILQRIKHVETNQKKLEEEIFTWKTRYWTLYSWLNEVSKSKLKVDPPTFHLMEVKELEKEFMRSVEKLSSIQKKRQETE